MKKPDNQYIVEPDREIIMAFMANLPVRKVPGIGRTSEAWLKALSIETCSDIWTHRGRLGVLRCDLTDIIRCYLGIGDNTVTSGSREDRQSCGRGWTFAPTSDYQQFLVELQAMAQQLSEDLAAGEVSGRTVTLEMKYDTFEVVRDYALTYSSTTD
jgi:DNA polymerase kappa